MSGRLDETQFGPGSLDEGMRRRSIYFTIKRSKLIPMMVQFDAPDSLQGMGRRPQTTIAPQALLLLNNAQVRAAAVAFAKRIDAPGKVSVEEKIKDAFRIALGRVPEKVEASEAGRFLASQTDSYRAAGRTEADHLALADFCQAVLGLNEFSYID